MDLEIAESLLELQGKVVSASRVDEYREYKKKVLWGLRELPFLLALDNKELAQQIDEFDKPTINIMELQHIWKHMMKKVLC